MLALETGFFRFCDHRTNAYSHLAERGISVCDHVRGHVQVEINGRGRVATIQNGHPCLVDLVSLVGHQLRLGSVSSESTSMAFSIVSLLFSGVFVSTGSSGCIVLLFPEHRGKSVYCTARTCCCCPI